MRHEKVNEIFRPLMNELAPEAVIDAYQNQIKELMQESKLLGSELKKTRIELEEMRLELNNALIEEFKICSGCAGAGDVRQTAKSTDIEESWIKCEECLGEGKVLK